MSNVIKNFGLDTQLISSVVGKFKPGSRIRLISKNNTYIPSLAEGTVDFVDDIIYKMHKETLMRRYEENKGLVIDKIKELLPNINLDGQWSLDIMQNGDDFWLIDMAIADTSALSECVPANKLKKSQENWIPELN